MTFIVEQCVFFFYFIYGFIYMIMDAYMNNQEIQLSAQIFLLG